MADGRIGAKEGILCQEPAGFTPYHHNPLISTSWFPAEACVSTREIRVLSIKQFGDLGSEATNALSFVDLKIIDDVGD